MDLGSDPVSTAFGVALGLSLWAVGARGFVDELAEFLRGRRPGPPDDDQGGEDR